jgi:hypothetical protein
MGLGRGCEVDPVVHLIAPRVVCGTAIMSAILLVGRKITASSL